MFLCCSITFWYKQVLKTSIVKKSVLTILFKNHVGASFQVGLYFKIPCSTVLILSNHVMHLDLAAMHKPLTTLRVYDSLHHYSLLGGATLHFLHLSRTVQYQINLCFVE